MKEELHSQSDPLESLREALRLSPDNVPLRQHFAEKLLELGLLAESEREYRMALGLSPRSPSLQMGLATVFYRQGKYPESLVLLEELLRIPHAPGAGYFLHARILLLTGSPEEARSAYREAVVRDPNLRNREFEQEAGFLSPQQEEAPPEKEKEKEKVRLKSGDDLEDLQDILVERPVISFDEVGGMEHLKEEIRLKIIYPLQNPEIYRTYGKQIGGGILMYGPPGCGKTHLARATAGEVKASFISVGINDVLDMWMGQSEQNLHEIFEQARVNNPCILFFDEVDALGASRSDMRHNAGRQLINQFLSELDGVESANEGVLILAATNAPWHLDSAFRRPGRFDRILFVPPPDEEARSAILKILLEGKPLDNVDTDAVAKKSKEFSGADLKAVVDLTVEGKLREAMRKGRPEPITTKDLLAAVKKHKPTTKEWFSTAKNYAIYSNQGGVYDDILSYLKMQ